MPKIKTKFQLSAGRVIFRESEGVEVALIATKGGEAWSLPKGLVERERKEPLEEAALREVLEETGLLGRVLERIDKVEYWYRWKEDDEPVRYHKIVYFFLIEHQGGTSGITTSRWTRSVGSHWQKPRESLRTKARGRSCTKPANFWASAIKRAMSQRAPRYPIDSLPHRLSRRSPG